MLGSDVPPDYRDMCQMAMALSRSTIVPPVLRGSAENVLALMLISQALQLPLAIVWQNVYLAQDGEVGQRSRLLHSLLRRAGHRFVYLEVSDQRAEGLLWIHGSTTPIEVSFTIEEAIRLGLVEEWRDRDRHWIRQPANMLRNRLLSRAVDWHCPEVKAGADWDPEGGLIVAGLGDPDAVAFSGLGPEVVRLLAQLDAIEENTELDATARVTALRGVWAEAKLLLDVVVDEMGTTLGGLISGRLATAKASQVEAGGKTKRKTKADREPLTPIALVCGCDALEVTQTGAHRDGCATAQADRAKGGEL
jgi:hypothetical protein